MPSEGEEDLSIFKKRMHSTLTADGSAGCSLAQFCKDFNSDWKRTVHSYAEQAGFLKVIDFLRSMPEEVTVNGNHIMPVMKPETKDVQDLIDRSKADNAANFKKKRPISTLPMQMRPPPGFRVSDRRPVFFPPHALSSAAPGPPTMHAASFFRPPVGISASNSFRPISRPPLVRPQYEPPYSQWSSVNGLWQKVDLDAGGGQNPNSTPKFDHYRGLSNVEALWDASSNLYAASLPPHSSNPLDKNSSLQATVPIKKNVFNYLNEYHDGIDNESGFPLVVSKKRQVTPEFEPGKIVENLTKVVDSPRGGAAADAAGSSATDLGYDSPDDNAECGEFLATFTGKRIPPLIYRIIALLQAAGGQMPFKLMQTQYEKNYSAKLTNAELRNVLGTPDAKNTVVAFQRSPMAALFHYELNAAGSGIVKLLIDVSNFNEFEIACCTNSKADDLLNRSMGTLLLASGAPLGSAASAMSLTMRLAPTSDFVSPKLPIFKVNDSLEEKIVDEHAAVNTFSSDSHTDAISPQNAAKSAVENAIAFSVPVYTPAARDLLMMAAIAYDLTAATTVSLKHLHAQIAKHEHFAPFARSASQMAGLLLTNFSDCFSIISNGTMNADLAIRATGIQPTERAKNVADFPASLHAFPCVADRLMASDKPIYAYIENVETIMVTENSRVRFTVQLADFEKARNDLKAFLADYDRILTDSRESPLELSSLVDGQRVLYRSTRRLRRCRVIDTTTAVDGVKRDLAKLQLQCMDSGKRYPKILAKSVFAFPASTTPKEKHRLPALAVYCEFADNVKIDVHRASEFLTDLRDKGYVVQLQIRNSYTISEYITVFEVEIYVRNGTSKEFKAPELD